MVIDKLRNKTPLQDMVPSDTVEDVVPDLVSPVTQSNRDDKDVVGVISNAQIVPSDSGYVDHGSFNQSQSIQSPRETNQNEMVDRI